jgi:hypothetical protein
MKPNKLDYVRVRPIKRGQNRLRRARALEISSRVHWDCLKVRILPSPLKGP